MEQTDPAACADLSMDRITSLIIASGLPSLIGPLADHFVEPSVNAYTCRRKHYQRSLILLVLFDFHCATGMAS